MELAFFLLLTALLFAAIVMWRMSKDNSVLDHETLTELRKIERNTAALVIIGANIQALLARLFQSFLQSARIHTMPKTVQVGQTANALINGLDQNGQPLALDSTYTVSYSASNPASVSFGTPNPDGSVVITALAADTVTIGAVITRPDGGTVTASPDTLTIVPVPPPAPVLTTASVSLQ